MDSQQVRWRVTNPVFVVPDLTEDALTWELGGAEGRHAARSMRLRAGEPLDLVNGFGLRVSGVVQSVVGDVIIVDVVRVIQEKAATPQVTLVQALAKGARDEMAVEICTELGVDRIIPWQADRSIVRWDSQRSKKGADKWRTVAFAAAKQARRATIPTVEPMVTSKGLTTQIAACKDVFICHEDASASIENASFGPNVMVIVGPEGGISDQEMEAFKDAGGKPISLGRNVLRASTAGAVAVARLNFLTGRDH